jgi:hypothetical protein
MYTIFRSCDEIVVINRPRSNRDFLGNHKVAKYSNSELAVRYQAQGRVKLLPAYLFGAETWPIHKPFARIGKRAHKRFVGHTNAIVNTFDKLASI